MLNVEAHNFNDISLSFVLFLVFVLFPVHRIFICLSMVLNACLYPEPVSIVDIYILNIRIIVIIMHGTLFSYLTQILDSFTARQIQYTKHKPQNTNAQRMENSNQTKHKTHIHCCCTF